MKHKKIIKTPTLGINAKSYMWGDDLLEIAKYCEKIAVENDITVTMNVPIVDIYRISLVAPHVIINAQFMDPIESGGTMGGVVAEALADAGADGVILNHASAKPMTLSQLIHAIKYAKRAGLYTFVCADSIEEVEIIASMHPTGIICEQSNLIGTGVVASEEYIHLTTKKIKDYDPNIIVMQGAGIKNGDDIYRNIKNGSESGGGASGVFCSTDPIAKIDDFLNGILRAKKDFGSRIYNGSLEKIKGDDLND